MFYCSKKLLCSSGRIKHTMLLLGTAVLSVQFSLLLVCASIDRDNVEIIWKPILQLKHFRVFFSCLLHPQTNKQTNKTAINTQHTNLNLFYSKPLILRWKGGPEASTGPFSLCNPIRHFAAEKAGMLFLSPSPSWHRAARSAVSVTRCVAEVPPEEEGMQLLPDGITQPSGSSVHATVLIERAWATDQPFAGGDTISHLLKLDQRRKLGFFSPFFFFYFFHLAFFFFFLKVRMLWLCK